MRAKADNGTAAGHPGNPLLKTFESSWRVFWDRRYRSHPRISAEDFCENDGITEQSLKKWMRQYDEEGLLLSRDTLFVKKLAEIDKIYVIVLAEIDKKH